MIISRKAAIGIGLSLLLIAFGCGRKEKSVPVAVIPPVEQARMILEQVAQQGEVDSSIVTLREVLESMAATDSSKSALVAACEGLMSLRGKDQVRGKAKEMLELLQ